ncbi:unnamed protein product, partial [Meganyctiphanes norvegica]
MADTAQPSPASAAAAGTTSASPLSSSSAEVPPSLQQANVVPHDVPPVDRSAVPVPPHADEPTSSVLPQAAVALHVESSSDPSLLPTTPKTLSVVPSDQTASLPVLDSSALPGPLVSPPPVRPVLSEGLLPTSKDAGTIKSSAMSTLKPDNKPSGRQEPVSKPVKLVRTKITGPDYSSVSPAVAPNVSTKTIDNKVASKDKIEVSEDKLKMSVDKIDNVGKPMEIQQTDTQSVVFTSKDNQENCAKVIKDNSKQTNNIITSSIETKNTLELPLELDIENKLLSKTCGVPSGKPTSSVHNVNTENTVKIIDTSVTSPVKNVIRTVESNPTDSAATTPRDSQENKGVLQESESLSTLQCKEKVITSGESNKSSLANSLLSNESNILEGISKVSNETESIALSKDTTITKDLLRKDDSSENNEKTIERHSNEISSSVSECAIEGKASNNVELAASEPEPVLPKPMETDLVDTDDTGGGGLLRNMENEVTSWAGDAEGDTAMSATTTTDAIITDKENITNKIDDVENDTLCERMQESETENENTELRNFSSITQLAAQDEKNKSADKDSNSSDLDLNMQSLESNVNNNSSSLNNGPVEITSNNGPVAAGEDVDESGRDVPSLEDIESTLDEVNQSPDIIGVNGCTVNENAIEAATSLEPVTIGSAMQPLEESMDAHSIAENSEAFTTETMALIESSADEDSSCVGGLVINSVVGAAEALAQFPPDEEDTEQTGPKELMDISISGPTNEEEGPAAKRLRLENGVEDPGKKLQDSDVKNVLLKVAPIKNGRGLWDAAKLKEILHNKGSILLRLHMSPDVAEADDTGHNQDLSAIMIEVKDDDHIMGLSHLDSDADYDPLALSIVEHMSPMASQQQGSGRGYSRSPIRGVTSGTPGLGGVGRSTSLQPAVPRGPGYQLDHLYDLEFEDPQHMGSPSSWTSQGVGSIGDSSTHTQARASPAKKHRSNPTARKSTSAIPGSRSSLGSSSNDGSGNSSIQATVAVAGSATPHRTTPSPTLSYTHDNSSSPPATLVKYNKKGKMRRILLKKLCTECGAQFNKAHQYMQHIKTHRPLLSCDQCDFKTKEAQKFRVHVNSHKRANPTIPCDHCDKLFTDDQLQRKHLKKWHSVYRCRFCSQDFQHEDILNKHLTVEHAYFPSMSYRRWYDTVESPIIDESGKPEDKNKFICHICNKSARNLYQLKIHVGQHLGVPSSKLADDLTIKKVSDVVSSVDKSAEDATAGTDLSQIHIKTEPGTSSDDDDDMTTNSGRTSVTHDSIENMLTPEVHIKQEVNTEGLDASGGVTLAPNYNSSFNAGGLEPSTSQDGHHMAAVAHPVALGLTEDVVFRCGLCQLDFTKPEDLYFHAVNLHKSDPPLPQGGASQRTMFRFICDICNESFLSTRTLRKHKEKHKQLQCPACPVKRKNTTKMLNHQKMVHKNKIRCQYKCLALFDNYQEASQHYTEVHGKEAFNATCPTCQGSFISRTRYETHITRCVKSDRPPLDKKQMICPSCDKQFIFPKSFETHIRRCGKPDHLRYDTSLDIEDNFITCNVCQIEFIDAAEYSDHLAECQSQMGIKHQENDDNKSISDNYSKNYQGEELETSKDKIKATFDSESENKSEGSRSFRQRRAKPISYAEDAQFEYLDYFPHGSSSSTSTSRVRKMSTSSLGADVGMMIVPEVVMATEDDVHVPEVIMGTGEDDFHKAGSSSSFPNKFGEAANSVDLEEEGSLHNPMMEDQLPAQDHNSHLPHRCKYCPFNFLDKHGAVSHVLNSHKGLLSRKIAVPQLCKVCGMVFKNQQSLCKHIAKHYGDLGWWDKLVPPNLLQQVFHRNYCWICKGNMGRKHLLHSAARNQIIDRYLRSKRLALAQPGVAYSCNHCNLSFVTRPNYWDHIKLHLESLPMMKPGKNFWPALMDDADTLSDKQNHNELKECTDCHIRFTDKEKLFQHLAGHVVYPYDGADEEEDDDDNDDNGGGMGGIFGEAGLGGIEAVMAGYESDSVTQGAGETVTTEQGVSGSATAQGDSDSATLSSQLNRQDNVELNPSSVVESEFYEQSGMANVTSLENQNINTTENSNIVSATTQAEGNNDNATLSSQVDNTQNNIELTPISAVESEFYEQSDIANIAASLENPNSGSSENSTNIYTGI